jgi:reversibly glycosylated polypeptide / UDP-arabinopyranose mutase
LIALVIPAIRERSLAEFLSAWDGKGDWDEIIVIEGNETKKFQPQGRWPIHHFSQAEIKQHLGDDAWIISKGDSACRCFGYLIAKRLGADWILNLDDDCLPYESNICERHLAAMQHTVCQPSAGVRTRGLPYRNLGTIECKLNLGLWRNVPDIDGPQGLLPQPYFVPPTGSKLANPQRRYPLCGMNLMFATELVPALYFPLMGAGYDYRRFDDIWAGWIFQKVAQQCSINWSYGEPVVEHVRASDPFDNLVKETPGISINETLWEKINRIELSSTDVPTCVSEIADDFQADNTCYLRDLGRALSVWLELLS